MQPIVTHQYGITLEHRVHIDEGRAAKIIGDLLNLDVQLDNGRGVAGILFGLECPQGQQRRNQHRHPARLCLSGHGPEVRRYRINIRLCEPVDPLLEQEEFRRVRVERGRRQYSPLSSGLAGHPHVLDRDGLTGIACRQQSLQDSWIRGLIIAIAIHEDVGAGRRAQDAIGNTVPKGQ